MAAAAWTTSPPDAPDVTVAASFPVSWAISFPAAINSSSKSTNTSLIAFIASVDSARGREPECFVFGPPAFMSGVTPSFSSIERPVDLFVSPME